MPPINSEINLAEFIDHTLLKPTATPEEIKQCCREAVQYNFPAVCIYPSSVSQAKELLHGSKTAICTVIGFPSGASTAATKLYEAQEAAENGATELDVVINLGLLKSGQSDKVHAEIAAICESTGQIVKAILETTVLNEAEKTLAAEICLDAGVAYLKTSTGWFGGATIADVELLKKVSRSRVGIKASGGISNAEQAIALVEAGATRLGTSYGVALMKQQKSGLSQ